MSNIADVLGGDKKADETSESKHQTKVDWADKYKKYKEWLSEKKGASPLLKHIK